MERFEINWLGVNYPAVEVTIFNGTADQQTITVSSTELEAVLLIDIEGSLISNEAYKLDEEITYYIEPHQFDLSHDEIARIVEASYS